MRRSFAFVFGLSLLLYGCGRPMPASKDAAPPQRVQVAQAAEQKLPANAAPPVNNRKIIYTAQVSLVTDDLDGFRTRLKTTLSGLEGFVSAEQLTGKVGSHRTGAWTVRVPVGEFDTFVEQLVHWGEVDSQKIHSDDVTEEFVDVESRLKNKRVEERRLLEILEQKTGDLEDVITVERAVSAVREQIERMDGRLRYLTDRIDLTTITITVREVENYVAPQPPTLGTEITRTFQASTGELLRGGKQLLLVAVAIAPWLVPLAVVLLPFALVYRRMQKHPAIS